MELLRVYSVRRDGAKGVSLYIPVRVQQVLHVFPGDDLGYYFDRKNKRIIIQKQEKK